MTMQVATIKEDKYKARDKYAEYRKAAKKFPRVKNYEVLRKTYRAISQGKHVIDLHESLRMAGLDAQGRPKLAICRADYTRCWLTRSDGKVRFSGAEWPRAAEMVQVPDSVFGSTLIRQRLRAIVPSIPPRFLPEETLDHFHILWEANWEAVPVDPMLLRHLSGPFFTVLAAWDLTPLEQAVLRASV